MADLKEKLQAGFKLWQFKIASIFFLLGVFVFAVGFGLLIFKKDNDSQVKLIPASEVLGESKLNEIVVDVDGAVVNPGVYHLSGEARTGDAITAAGGLSGDADSSRVNLAAKISDGQKIYVPSKFQITNSKLQNEEVGTLASELISINNATEKELDTLSGVGPVTAGKIIGARPYSSIEELVSKKAVTKSVFEKIKGLVTI